VTAAFLTAEGGLTSDFEVLEGFDFPILNTLVRKLGEQCMSKFERVSMGRLWTYGGEVVGMVSRKRTGKRREYFVKISR
jgi:hypothetical protein